MKKSQKAFSILSTFFFGLVLVACSHNQTVAENDGSYVESQEEEQVAAAELESYQAEAAQAAEAEVTDEAPLLGSFSLDGESGGALYQEDAPQPDVVASPVQDVAVASEVATPWKMVESPKQKEAMVAAVTEPVVEQSVLEEPAVQPYAPPRDLLAEELGAAKNEAEPQLANAEINQSFFKNNYVWLGVGLVFLGIVVFFTTRKKEDEQGPIV